MASQRFVPFVLLFLAISVVGGVSGRPLQRDLRVGVVDTKRVLQGDARFLSASAELVRQEQEVLAKGATERDVELQLVRKAALELVATSMIRIEGAVRVVAMREGVLVVLRKDGKSDDVAFCGTRMHDTSVMFVSDEADLTEMVIREINLKKN